MIKEIIATGVDANAAIESGALLLGLPREEVQFEIIDLPRKGGFLGLKKLPAKVRVWVELPDEKPARSEKPRRQEAPKKEQKAENKPAAPKAEKKPARSEKPAPRVEKPIRVEAEKPAPVEIEPTEEVRAKVEKAAAYVTEILKAMGLTDFTLTPATTRKMSACSWQVSKSAASSAAGRDPGCHPVPGQSGSQPR
ncbi:MAG: Jag N-terminal domain-containing protein [Angelakisella sp.]